MQGHSIAHPDGVQGLQTSTHYYAHRLLALTVLCLGRSNFPQLVGTTCACFSIFPVLASWLSALYDIRATARARKVSGLEDVGCSHTLSCGEFCTVAAKAGTAGPPRTRIHLAHPTHVVATQQCRPHKQPRAVLWTGWHIYGHAQRRLPTTLRLLL